jgi:hypothetical protein
VTPRLRIEELEERVGEKNRSRGGGTGERMRAKGLLLQRRLLRAMRRGEVVREASTMSSTALAACHPAILPSCNPAL